MADMENSTPASPVAQPDSCANGNTKSADGSMKIGGATLTWKTEEIESNSNLDRGVTSSDDSGKDQNVPENGVEENQNPVQESAEKICASKPESDAVIGSEKFESAKATSENGYLAKLSEKPENADDSTVEKMSKLEQQNEAGDFDSDGDSGSDDDDEGGGYLDEEDELANIIAEKAKGELDEDSASENDNPEVPDAGTDAESEDKNEEDVEKNEEEESSQGACDEGLNARTQKVLRDAAKDDAIGGEWVPEVKPMTDLLAKIRQQHEDTVQRTKNHVTNVQQKERDAVLDRILEDIDESNCELEIVDAPDKPGPSERNLPESPKRDEVDNLESPVKSKESMEKEKESSLMDDLEDVDMNAVTSDGNLSDSEDDEDEFGSELEFKTHTNSQENQNPAGSPKATDTAIKCDNEEMQHEVNLDENTENASIDLDETQSPEKEIEVAVPSVEEKEIQNESPAARSTEEKVDEKSEKESPVSKGQKRAALFALFAEDSKRKKPNAGDSGEGAQFVEFEAEMSEDEGHSEDDDMQDSDEEELAEMLGDEVDGKDDEKIRGKMHSEWQAEQDKRDLQDAVRTVQGGWRRNKKRSRNLELDDEGDGSLQASRRRRLAKNKYQPGENESDADSSDASSENESEESDSELRSDSESDSGSEAGSDQPADHFDHQTDPISGKKIELDNGKEDFEDDAEMDGDAQKRSKNGGVDSPRTLTAEDFIQLRPLNAANVTSNAEKPSKENKNSFAFCPRSRNVTQRSKIQQDRSEYQFLDPERHFPFEKAKKEVAPPKPAERSKPHKKPALFKMLEKIDKSTRN